MHRFSLTIGARLLASFSLLLLLMACMTAIALTQLRAAHQTALALTEDRLARQQLASDWLNAVDLGGAYAVSIAKSDSLELAQYFEAQLSTSDAATRELERRMRAQRLDAREAELAERIAAHGRDYLDSRGQVFKFKEVGRTPEAEQLFAARMAPGLRQYRQSIAALLSYQTEAAGAMAASAGRDYEASVLLLGGLGALSVALGALLAWRLTRSVAPPLRQALEIAQSVAQGDLRPCKPAAAGQDEIGQLLGAQLAMHASLAQIVRQVRDGADAISAASHRIAEGSQDLAGRTEAQAASLQETAASMEQLSVTVRQNADSAAEAGALAAAAATAANRGADAVAQVAGGMERIRQSSRNIADIIDVINAMALQTNILALNAAVEAARAGPHGRGFAVVAGEVRVLAQRSAAAAQEIRQLIDESAQQVDSGSALVRQAGAGMGDIVRGVEQVSRIMARISAASHEQSAGVGQANLAIGRIDQATQQNAARVEQAAASAQDLRLQAGALARTVATFRLPDQAAAADASRCA